MNAVIYTEDDREFISMGTILQEEEDMRVFRDPLDGHGHYEYAYDLVVVALEGARGMNVVFEWRNRHPESKIVWASSDADFAKTAIRWHLSGFLVRPFAEEDFRGSVRRALEKGCQS